MLEGVEEQAFLDVDKRVQTEFVPHLPGFVRRTTARGADGGWIVVTLWGTHADAEAASVRAEHDDTVRGFTELIDASTLSTARYETLD